MFWQLLDWCVVHWVQCAVPPLCAAPLQINTGRNSLMHNTSLMHSALPLMHNAGQIFLENEVFDFLCSICLQIAIFSFQGYLAQWNRWITLLSLYIWMAFNFYLFQTHFLMSKSLLVINFVFPFDVWLFFIIWWVDALMLLFLAVAGVGKVTKGSS